ncbi:MAG: TetR/AcrR family transcriptional regulator [Spirochaetales bacterium]|nr:TetR/AcrR family transcriptional regulator [Spirochaetales bacterium]
MARPRKEDLENLAPTGDRILSAAVDLFSREGFAGTSVRAIARQVELNEASIYNHFPSKAAILTAAIDRLEERLLRPGLKAAEGPAEASPEALTAAVMKGAANFFLRADTDMLKTWRVLVIEEYRNAKAREALEAHIFKAPRDYFKNLLSQWQEEGYLRASADTEAAAEALASVFFEFSFVANLSAAWNQTDPADLNRLRSQVRFISQALI